MLVPMMKQFIPQHILSLSLLSYPNTFSNGKFLQDYCKWVIAIWKIRLNFQLQERQIGIKSQLAQ